MHRTIINEIILTQDIQKGKLNKLEDTTLSNQDICHNYSFKTMNIIELEAVVPNAREMFPSEN